MDLLKDFNKCQCECHRKVKKLEYTVTNFLLILLAN